MGNYRLAKIGALLVMLHFGGCAAPAPVVSLPGGAVSSGTSTEVEGFWFQAGGQFIEEGSPGVIFGMMKRPGGNREFAYLVVFRPPANGKFDHSIGLLAPDPASITMTDHLAYGSKNIDLKLEIAFDRTAKTIKKERMTLGGKEVDIAKGRLFVVDLRAETPTPEQLPAKSPINLPDPKDPKDVRSIVAGVFEALPHESQAVREVFDEHGGAGSARK